MTAYETCRLALEPFLPPLYKQVRQKLAALVNDVEDGPTVVDVGGRKSPYTIGIPARITLLDLPRESELQQELNLGLDKQIIDKIQKRRSNIENLVLGDMTCSGLPDETFDLAVSVEVLEHVEADRVFVSEVRRVLKAGGVFLMTTPNGDWVKNTNPDHKRHYKRKELSDLLNEYFDEVSVDYAIAGGYFRKLGLRSWSLGHPIRTASSVLGNIINAVQSEGSTISNQAMGTHHLIAIARKAK